MTFLRADGILCCTCRTYGDAASRKALFYRGQCNGAYRGEICRVHAWRNNPMKVCDEGCWQHGLVTRRALRNVIKSP